MTTLKEDLARLSGPAIYGLRRWNQDTNDERDRLGAGSRSMGSGSSGRGFCHWCRRNRSQVNAVLSNK